MLLSANIPRLISAFPTSSALPAGGHHRSSKQTHHHGDRVSSSPVNVSEHFPAQPVNEAEFWINAGIAMALVVLGGLFAGLTLG